MRSKARPANDLGLTQEQIVAVGITLLREGGLDAVSMRKIGARLGVQAPSLYWHVSSKEVLHGLMSKAIFQSCLDSMPRCQDWRQWLREFGLALWRAQRTTPDVQRLILAAPVDKKERDKTQAALSSELESLGLDAGIGNVAQQSVQALVTGWTTLRSRSHAGSAEDALRESLDALIAGWGTRGKSRKS